MISGAYQTESSSPGFIRSADGTFAEFDGPHSNDVYSLAINGKGETTGPEQRTDLIDGLIRSPDGRFTTFQVPKSADTNPTAINDKGEIVGFFVDRKNVMHGFLRVK